MNVSVVPLDELRAAGRWQSWRALAEIAPPFLGPEFFALALPLSQHGTPLVAVAMEDERIVGALPLVLDRHTLRPLRTDHSPGFDYCGDPGALEAIWEHLRDDERWSELVLDKLPAESPLVRRMTALALADNCPTIVTSEGGHPYLSLAGFAARMTTKFRTNVRRCERKAGDLVLERIATPSRADFDEALAIEALAWKAAAGTNIATDERAVHLYRASSRLYGRRGQSALYFLRVGGKRIAMLYALETTRTLYALKMGYDPHYASLSPGHLLVWKVAAAAEARGLAELDFVGRADEWKRKWTNELHEQKRVVIYRRSARGLVRYGLREIIKPWLPDTVRETPRSPLPRRCQRTDLVGHHSVAARVRDRVGRGLGIKSGLRRILSRAPKSARTGAPSAFAVGSYVRVRDKEAITATLDTKHRTRGLAFVPAQLATCGQVYRVARGVQRLRDDHGRFRAVSRTVLLEGVDCGIEGDHTGCGRHCPLMYRDEWLEAAAAPAKSPPHPVSRPHARVRDVDEIVAGLDLFGRRDGVTFMPEMAQYAGGRFAVAGHLGDVFELDHWVRPQRDVYMLDGVQCKGAICGKNGPCDRACTLMWHADWLILEAEHEMR